MNDKFSVIIPTLWKSDRIYKLLSDLNTCEQVGEIILIDNSNEYAEKIKTIPSKVKIVPRDQNMYVNPAWNLGVSLSKFNNLCISNDDINFDTSVFHFIKDHIDSGIVGQSTSNYRTFPSSMNFKVEKIQERPSGWGCLLFLKKSNWVSIPEKLKIACGDDFLMDSVYGGAWQLTGFPIETRMSSTSLLHEFKKIQDDDIATYSSTCSPFISVLTITYKRKNFLEEAIYSFLNQIYDGPMEMVIINDCPDVQYVFDHKNIKVINLNYRFSSISEKLKYGFIACGANNIYRLDDDDLLCPWALKCVSQQINEKRGMEVYRSENHYLFKNNKFSIKKSSVNNGNVYSKKYILETNFPNKSGNEDVDFTITFPKKVYTKQNQSTMIYRWGMGTYHISTMGFNNEYTLKNTDNLCANESGTVKLIPTFHNDYYSQIPADDLEKYKVK
jgi:glycosyltransferase involved in cell wall biosynthesis